MKIAAIDYGLNCGTAIGTFEDIHSNFIEVKKLYLKTFVDDFPELFRFLKEESPYSVVLEACPYRAAGESLHIFERTQAMLINQLGYQVGKEILEFNELVIIGPGLWKPFVKKQDILYTRWNPKTQHEKDAMSLLWYALTISTKKEVIYV